MRARLIVACCLLALACNPEKRRLTERLNALEQQRARMMERLRSQQEALRDTESRLDALQRELTAYNTDVHAFIENHKIAVACIGASRSTWEGGNSFDNEISAAQRLGAALCAVALFNGEFANEVRHVTDKLREADTRVHEMNDQIAALRRRIDDERRNVDVRKAQIDQLDADIADVQSRLGIPVSDKVRSSVSLPA